jgi:hypothetical protein
MSMVKSRRPRNRGRKGRGRDGVVDTRVARSVVWNLNSQGYPNVSRLLATDNRPHHVWQTAELGNILTSSSGGEVDGVQSFTMNQIQGISSWLAVFDQYKIAEIEVWFTPSSSSSGNIDNFRLLTVVDYDDTTAITVNALLQYSNVTDTGRTEGVYRRFVPHNATQIATTGSTTLSKNNVAGWIDSSQPAALHYGTKFALTATSTTVVLAIRVRFHIMFRNCF